MKSQQISIIDLITKRGWNPDLIHIYLGTRKVSFDLVKVIEIENRLKKQGIEFKTKEAILKEYVEQK